jgi:hypothetical protein
VELFRALTLAITFLFSLPIAAPAPTLARAATVAEFKIHVAEPVYAGLPVWIQADLPEMLTAHYPYDSDPGWFGQNKIELKREGTILTPLTFPTPPSGGGVFGGWIAPPGSPTNRLPLHLKYLLDTPGTYSVRWTVVRREISSETRQFVETMLAQSEWITFELRPSTPKQRASSLRNQLARARIDPGVVAGDILPSIMSQAPNREVLRAVIGELYSDSDAVIAYALGCAYRFPDRDLHAETMEAIRHTGPSERLSYFVSWRVDLFKNDTSEIVHASLSSLQSRWDAEVVGALKMLIVETHLANSQISAPPRPRVIADKAVLAAAPNLLKRSVRVQSALAEFLGDVKTSGSRDLLWQMVGSSGFGNEQAAIALTWIANSGDLPKLGELLVKLGGTDPTGRDRTSLIYGLMKAYDDAAIPYLEKAVTDSPYAFVRLQSAEQLVARGSPIAFRFFLETVNQNPFYKAEAVRSLKDRFPRDLSPTSDDAAVIAFLKARLNQ